MCLSAPDVGSWSISGVVSCFRTFTFILTYFLTVSWPYVCLFYTAVVEAPTGRVTLGANMANGIEQKGIDTIQQCIKKCAAAGLGIPATVCISVGPVLAPKLYD